MSESVIQPKRQGPVEAAIATETPPDPVAPAVSLLTVSPAADDQAERATPDEVTVRATEVALMRGDRWLGLSRRDWQRLLALGLAATAACLFLWQVQSILPPFLIAFFLAALLDPTIRMLEQHGRSRVRAILTLYVFGVCLVALFFLFVVPRARDQIEELSQNFNVYFTNIQSTADAFLHHNAGMLRLLGIKQERISDLFQQRSGPLKDTINTLLGGVTGFLTGAASKILWLIIIPVTAFFFMRDYPVLRARIISLFPEAYQTQVDRMSREIVDVFSAYIRGLAKICLLYALTAFVIFQLLGLKYALFLGIMAGAFYAVPYVGQLITALVSGAVAYSMDSHTALLFVHIPANSIGYTLAVVLCAIVAQNLFDQIVYPRVVGASVGLHPVVSIFALMAGATLFGVLGMLLAVPVAASIQIVLMYLFPKLTQPPPPHLLEQTPPLA
ncbi:MAG TPA: AI-2E family transporter [Chthonomonadaceae bacterium]|nr:AI-2E family transporter [Chthonomonadaceae bacterium]